MNKKQCNNVNSTEVNKEEVLRFYENQMNDKFKTDEKIMKVKNLILKNNNSQK